MHNRRAPLAKCCIFSINTMQLSLWVGEDFREDNRLQHDTEIKAEIIGRGCDLMRFFRAAFNGREDVCAGRCGGR